MILIEKNGERQCVKSMDGYDGWTVLANSVSEPPEHSEWIAGQGYVVDEVKAAEVAEESRLRALPRRELMAEMETKLDFLKGELAKRDVQIAELALATQFVVTPLADITVDNQS